MAPKAAALSEREKSRLRVGVLVDRDVRNWLYEPVLGDHPEAVVAKGRAPAPFVSATTEAERIEVPTPPLLTENASEEGGFSFSARGGGA